MFHGIGRCSCTIAWCLLTSAFTVSSCQTDGLKVGSVNCDGVSNQTLVISFSRATDRLSVDGKRFVLLLSYNGTYRSDVRPCFLLRFECSLPEERFGTSAWSRAPASSSSPAPCCSTQRSTRRDGVCWMGCFSRLDRFAGQSGDGPAIHLRFDAPIESLPGAGSES